MLLKSAKLLQIHILCFEALVRLSLRLGVIYDSVALLFKKFTLLYERSFVYIIDTPINGG